MRDEILRLSQELEGKEDEVIKKKFWRIVGKVKRGEIEVSEEDIEELSKIRDRFFKKRIVLSAKRGSLPFSDWFCSIISHLSLGKLKCQRLHLHPTLFV